MAVAREVPVAYIPGLMVRRAADQCPGEAKADRRDADVMADITRTRRTQIHCLDTGSDEVLYELRAPPAGYGSSGRSPSGPEAS